LWERERERQRERGAEQKEREREQRGTGAKRSGTLAVVRAKDSRIVVERWASLRHCEKDRLQTTSRVQSNEVQTKRVQTRSRQAGPDEHGPDRQGLERHDSDRQRADRQGPDRQGVYRQSSNNVHGLDRQSSTQNILFRIIVHRLVSKGLDRI